MKNDWLGPSQALALCLLIISSDGVLAKEEHRGGPGKGGTKNAPSHVQKAERAAHAKRRDAPTVGDSAYWRRDWNVIEFLGAGFGAAALRQLLNDDLRLLDIGAKPLPPGIQKKLARGKPLPPGIAKRHPTGLLAETLPRVDGHDWLVIGRNLVLVTAGTLIVREILHEVFD